MGLTARIKEVLKLTARTRSTGHRPSSNDLDEKAAASGLWDSENTSPTLPNRNGRNVGFERLPLELIEAIFDSFQQDKRTLMVCGLVCKAWLHPSYRRLFYDTRLNWDQLCSAFGNYLLDPRPVSIAAPFIRRLHIRCDSTDQWNFDFLLHGGFHSITSLSLNTLRWDKIYPAIQRTIVDRFKTITRLHLQKVVTSSFSKLARLICAFRCLENLILGKTVWHSSNKPSRPLRLPPRLHALELDGDEFTEILEWLGSFGQALTLRNVCFLKPCEDHYQVINTFLRVLGPSLESFRIRLAGIDCPIRLDRNRHLRRLHLDVSRGLPDETGLVPLLSGVTSQHIEEMSLSVLHIPADQKDNFDDCVPMEWGDVDTVLAAPQFSNLKTVSVRHTVYNHRRAGTEYPLEWLLARLPIFRERGILRSCETTRRGPFI